MHQMLPCIMCTHALAEAFRKKIFCFNSLIRLFIYLFLDTFFLYYKGILAFIFEHVMLQEINNNCKTQEQIQGISGTTHL